MLAWYEPHPGSELAATVETACIADAGYDGGRCNWAYAVERHQSPCRLWEERAYALLKDELRRRKISLKTLSVKLTALGLRQSQDQVTRKLNRKRFSAAFMLACLVALEVEAVRMRDVLKLGA
jgi:hypothetical protein